MAAGTRGVACSLGTVFDGTLSLAAGASGVLPENRLRRGRLVCPVAERSGVPLENRLPQRRFFVQGSRGAARFLKNVYGGDASKFGRRVAWCASGENAVARRAFFRFAVERDGIPFGEKDAPRSMVETSGAPTRKTSFDRWSR